jgi:hypothetical protein
VPVPFIKTISKAEGQLNFGKITWKGLPKNVYIEADTSEGFEQDETYYKINNNKYE